MSIRDLAKRAIDEGLEKVSPERATDLLLDATGKAREHLESTGQLEPALSAGLDELEKAAPSVATAGREELGELVREVWEASEADDLSRFDAMSFAELIADEEAVARAAIAAEHARREWRAALVAVAKTIGKATASKLLPLVLGAVL